MERMLAVVFNEESKAYEATRALRQLDAEGSIAVHGQVVITNTAAGTTIKNADGEYPLRMLAGTAIGSLVGLLAGPVGVGVGALADFCQAAWTRCSQPAWIQTFWPRSPIRCNLASTRWSRT